jgi:phosphoglycerate dehydrogenase-like enzyme
MGFTIVTEMALPGLEQALSAACPETRLLTLDAALPLPPQVPGEVLLAPVVGGARLKAIMAAMPDLRWLHLYGTGIDGFDLGAVPADLALTCSRGASAIPISEWVMGCMLAFEKELPTSWISAPPQAWWSARLGTLANKTLALAGLGGIGNALARRALAFDMRVRALVRTPRESLQPGIELVASREALLAGADHIVLCLPATAQTRHFINREALQSCKPGAHLVNIARGSLVDQEALRSALDAGQLARASLDVAEPEPLPAGHWLYTHPGVRLSPHISWSAPGALDAVLQAFLDNLPRFARGEALVGSVDREAGY